MQKKIILLLTVLLTCSLSVNGYLWLNIACTAVSQDPATGLAPAPITKLAFNQDNNNEPVKNGLSAPLISPAVKQSVRGETSADNVQLLISQAKQLFLDHQFSQAVDYYEQLQERDEISAEQLKNHWLTGAYQWLSENESVLLADLLSAVLARQPYDQAWLLVKVAWFKKNQKALDAIAVYQILIRHAFDVQKEDLWTTQVHLLAKQQTAVFKQASAWQEMVDFNLYLLAQEPHYPPYLLVLSEAYISLGEVTSAQNYLDNLVDEEAYQYQVAALQALLTREKRATQGIALNRVNNQFIVDALINGQQNAPLMIDTGASITVISTRFYHRLEQTTALEKVRELTINTAGGDARAFTVKVDQFSIGDYLLTDFEMVVMDLPHFDKAEGLLGMNFLKAFQFEIDQANARLFLAIH